MLRLEHPGELPGLNPPINPVELTGVAPPENYADDDVVPTLLPSNYGRDDESDDKK